MFKSISSVLPEPGKPVQGPGDAGVKRVFMVLHGFYGNLFLSKFATGSLDEAGEDQGIANARRVWAYSLREYDGDTVKLALRRCQQHHPEFPPSLPQFVALCEAAKPREVYRPPVMPAALEMSQELREQRIREQREKAAGLLREIKEQQQTSGLDLLKQAIAAAVGEAGGDEASELLRLDRELAPRSAA